MKKNLNQAGFTLIELLVVIAIIGILSTLAVVALNTARMKSRDGKRVSDIKQVQTALELYFNDKSEYPDGFTAALDLGRTNAVALCAPVAGTGGFANAACDPADVTYMGEVPHTSDIAESGCTTLENEFTYTTPAASGSSSYAITFCLGGLTGDLAGGVHTATQEGVQ